MKLADGCRIILQHLHDLAMENGLSSSLSNQDQISELLGLPVNRCRVFIDYLKQERLVDARSFDDGAIYYLSITSEGLNLVDDVSEFNRKFRTNTTNTYNPMNISNSTVGGASVHGDVTVSNSLNEINKQIEQDQEFTDAQKAQLIKLIEILTKDARETKTLRSETKSLITSTISGMTGNLLSSAIGYVFNALISLHS